MCHSAVRSDSRMIPTRSAFTVCPVPPVRTLLDRLWQQALPPMTASRTVAPPWPCDHQRPQSVTSGPTPMNTGKDWGGVVAMQ